MSVWRGHVFLVSKSCHGCQLWTHSMPGAICLSWKFLRCSGKQGLLLPLFSSVFCLSFSQCFAFASVCFAAFQLCFSFISSFTINPIPLAPSQAEPVPNSEALVPSYFSGRCRYSLPLSSPGIQAPHVLSPSCLSKPLTEEGMILPLRLC